MQDDMHQAIRELLVLDEKIRNNLQVLAYLANDDFGRIAIERIVRDVTDFKVFLREHLDEGDASNDDR